MGVFFALSDLWRKSKNYRLKSKKYALKSLGFKCFVGTLKCLILTRTSFVVQCGEKKEAEGRSKIQKSEENLFSQTQTRAQQLLLVLITARKEIRIIMASIVQSIHMSAKASVAKTESLKRQRSVKSVSRTSNVTFASSEETVDRRHAMSLFAVRREMLFFVFFCLQFGCKTLALRASSSARDDDASRVRFERAQTRPRCERSIDPTDAYSHATTKSSKQYASILRKEGVEKRSSSS